MQDPSRTRLVPLIDQLHSKKPLSSNLAAKGIGDIWSGKGVGITGNLGTDVPLPGIMSRLPARPPPWRLQPGPPR